MFAEGNTSNSGTSARGPFASPPAACSLQRGASGKPTEHLRHLVGLLASHFSHKLASHCTQVPSFLSTKGSISSGTRHLMHLRARHTTQGLRRRRCPQDTTQARARQGKAHRRAAAGGRRPRGHMHAAKSDTRLTCCSCTWRSPSCPSCRRHQPDQLQPSSSRDRTGRRRQPRKPPQSTVLRVPCVIARTRWILRLVRMMPGCSPWAAYPDGTHRWRAGRPGPPGR